MRENREFDILENADDNEIELLAKVPVLTQKEKDRMLKMSKKKLDNKNRENNIEEQVSGVEQYRRPKWQPIFSAAACVALVAGIIGTSGLLHKNKQNVPDTAYAETVIGLFERINELNLICAGGGVELEDGAPIEYSVNSSEGFHDYNYYIVDDDRFSTIDEVEDYFGRFVAGPLELKYDTAASEGSRENEAPVFRGWYNDDQTYTLYFLKRDDAEENAEKIELRKDSEGTVAVDIRATDSEEIKAVYDRCCDFSVPAKVSGNDCTVYGRMVLDDGQWKISEYAFSPDGLAKDGSHIYDACAAMDAVEEFDAFISTDVISVDESDEKALYTNGSEMKYYRITDKAFRNKEDLKKYILNSFTDSVFRNCPGVLGGYAPVFMEFDGRLYRNAHVGLKHNIRFFGEPQVTVTGADSFTVEASSSTAYSSVETVTINCVREGGRWKVESFVSEAYPGSSSVQ